MQTNSLKTNSFVHETPNLNAFPRKVSLFSLPECSKYLFMPHEDQLLPYHPQETCPHFQKAANQMRLEMKKLILKKDYPCIAAIRSFTTNDYKVGMYSQFGTGFSSLDIGLDLLFFLQEQKFTASPYSTFWAAFPDGSSMTEKEFESKLWNELSFIASHDKFKAPWDSEVSDNPYDPNFCFSLGGSAFFVVGLHSRSSRLARRFPYPVLVFNVYHQFQQLIDDGKYDPMVNINRKKDIRYQGNVNPMSEKYGDTWESIQFSGANNPSDWKCPFKHLQT